MCATKNIVNENETHTVPYATVKHIKDIASDRRPEKAFCLLQIYVRLVNADCCAYVVSKSDWTGVSLTEQN